MPFLMIGLQKIVQLRCAHTPHKDKAGEKLIYFSTSITRLIGMGTDWTWHWYRSILKGSLSPLIQICAKNDFKLTRIQVGKSVRD